MLRECLYCKPAKKSSEVRTKGSYLRKSDGVLVRRYQCLSCKKTFSEATEEREYQHKKRQINPLVYELLCSGVSQRRCARVLNVNLKTIARKLKFLGQEAIESLDLANRFYKKCLTVEFDDLETHEHSKCKPLSVTMAVESKSRRILGFEVARMPAKGPLAKVARKRYGYRKDERGRKRKILFEYLKDIVDERAHFKSDQAPGYPMDVKKYFPLSTHETYKSRKACVTGQGELKAGGFDPLFSLNHSFAMLRANINRLFRRTWNTTKVPLRLKDHIAMYCVYHNSLLIRK